jgi:hypothetical protein
MAEWPEKKAAIIEALKAPYPSPEELTELASLDLPQYTEGFVKSLTRVGLTHFPRRDSLSLVALLSMMSQLQDDQGYVWEALATFFIDVSVSHAVRAAERGERENFAVFQRLIHDLYPLMDCAEDPDNCKFKPVPFETVAVLLALEACN